MIYIEDIYKKILGLNNEDDVFNYLVNNTKDTIKSWEYFVNWKKVLKNAKDLEIQLNILNYLVGKDNIKDELRTLLKTYPEVLKTVPILIATRDKEFKVLDPSEENVFNFKDYNFKRKVQKGEYLSELEIESAVEFLEKVGVLELFENKLIKNVVDYVLGVEVGLDSNGRKNRTGDSMENIVEVLVNRLCEENQWEYITQATVIKIKEKWNIDVPTDKSKRRYDFAINNNGKILLVEVNYYNGGGSKLKSVANEFTKLNSYIEDGGFTFCWITDGEGWQTAKQPLRDAFDKMGYIFNLTMVENGSLEYIIKNMNSR